MRTKHAILAQARQPLLVTRVPVLPAPVILGLARYMCTGTASQAQLCNPCTFITSPITVKSKKVVSPDSSQLSAWFWTACTPTLCLGILACMRPVPHTMQVNSVGSSSCTIRSNTTRSRFKDLVPGRVPTSTTGTAVHTDTRWILKFRSTDAPAAARARRSAPTRVLSRRLRRRQSVG